MESSENDMYHFDPDRTCQGLALVITNFTSGKNIRKGADSDHKNMTESFKRLGFEVICHKDVSKSKFTYLLDQYSRQRDWNKYNCFALAISSHGCEIEKKENGNIVKHHVIQMFDDSLMYTNDVVDYFSDRKCKGLSNKPKIFLIQACRIPSSKSTDAHRSAGIGFDQGCFLPNPTQPNPAQPNPVKTNPVKPNPVKPNPVIPIQQTALKADVDSSSQDTTNIKDSSVEDQDEIDPPKAQIIYPPAPVKITSVPCHNDMLIMFACPEDHYAVRRKIGGSYMLRLFSESVGGSYTKSGSANLMDMLRDVTYQMSEMTFHGSKEYKTVPCIVHKLRKDVIFTHGRNMVKNALTGGGCCACGIM